MSFDPAHARAVRFTWPDDMASGSLDDWLYAIFAGRHEHVGRICHSPVDAARNTAARQCLQAPPDITEFLWADADTRINDRPALAPLLEAEADIVGARYPLGTASCWASPHIVHFGLVRIQRPVLERVVALHPQPFLTTLSNDGTRKVDCHCARFCRFALDLGYTVQQAGVCDHRKSLENR